jgi:hypothetical protein
MTGARVGRCHSSATTGSQLARALFADATIAAMMDRLLHRAIGFELGGPSKRQKRDRSSVD